MCTLKIFFSFFKYFKNIKNKKQIKLIEYVYFSSTGKKILRNSCSFKIEHILWQVIKKFVLIHEVTDSQQCRFLKVVLGLRLITKSFNFALLKL